MAKLATRVQAIVSGECGSMTIMGMLLFFATCMIGAIALDVTHLNAAKAQLQVVSDAAAHAALYNRERLPVAASQAAAIATAQASLPAGFYGATLRPDNIEFGTWDFENGVFTAAPNSRQAVRVVASRTAATSNPVTSFLFRAVGIKAFDVAAGTIYTTYRPGCLREGIVAEGVVDLRSNNGFYAGFCVHSNTYVSLNQNNYFEPGTVVSMPDTADIDLPASGFKKNEGLETALRSGVFRLRIIRQLPEIIQSFTQPSFRALPSYIVNTTVSVQANLTTVTPLLLPQGRVYHISCGGTQLTLGSGTYRNMVIVTPCPVRLSNGVALENTVIATTSTSSMSVTAPNGLRVGKNDNCAEGGGAQILTLGGMHFAAGLEAYQGQFIARGDIDFAANANGIEGISMIAGGRVSGTSNMEMGFCDGGMGGNFEVDYFRPVR